MVGILKSEAPAAAAAPVKTIRRPERPDKKQLDESLNAEKSAADAAGKRIQEIKLVLEQHRNWRVAGSPESALARAAADQLNVQFHDEVEKKRGLKSELERLSEQMRTEARASKKPLGLDKVDALTNKLRDRLEHSSEPLSGKEQMSMVQQIEELTKWKKFLKECTSKIEGLKSAIAEKDEILDKLSTERAKQREALEAIKKKEAANAPDVGALREEKNSAYEKIQLHRENMKKLKEEFQAKETQFFEADREYRKRQKVLAEKRHAEFMEREKRRQERRSQMAKEEEVDEYYDKISACEKILAELQRFTAVATAPRIEGVDDAEEEEKRARQAKLENVQGFGCLLKSKKDRDDDDWFGKPKTVKKPSSNGNKSAKSGSTKLVLQHHVILSFSEVNLPQPRTLGEVADCLEKVKAKKDEFVKLQAETKVRSKAAQAEEVVDGQNGEAEAEEGEAEAEEGVAEAEEGQNGEAKAEAGQNGEAEAEEGQSGEAHAEEVIEAEAAAEPEAEAAVNGAASDDVSESSTGEEEEKNSLAAVNVVETENEEAIPAVAVEKETEDNVGAKVPKVAEETETGAVADETKTDSGATVAATEAAN